MTHRTRRARGFTLIELMVVVLIATLLTIIAVPSYTAQMRKSRRTEAKTALLDLAGREERFMATNGTYTNSAANLGYPSSGNFATGIPVGSGYYNVTIPTVTAASAPSTTNLNGVPAAYTITATAAGTQTSDKQCTTMSINQMGQQTSADNNGSATTGCW
jgi:type IV pilus assembly protein PilE